MKRKMSFDEIEKRRFHSRVRKLRKYCDTHNFTLLSMEEEPPITWLCILSENEMEVGEPLHLCDEDSESYFLSPQEYEEVDLFD